MKPSQLARDLETLINEANEKYALQLTRVQQRLYNDLIAQLKNLELDSDGFIRQNAANRRILDKAEAVFNDTINSSIYKAAIVRHLSVIKDINDMNESYFKGIRESFSPNKNFIKALQKQVIKEVNTFILQDGLKVNVAGPLNQIMTQNISVGGSFSGFLQQVKNYVVGNDKVQGRILSYARNYVSDTLFNYSRAYQQAVTDDLGLEFYLYSGGLTDTSREFCVERVEQFFHHNEIEAWASLTWAGKNKLTTESSIFILCGGHACKHSMIPVDVLIVPKDVIERNTKSGNYKP